jgi:hypothetical protein
MFNYSTHSLYKLYPSNRSIRSSPTQPASTPACDFCTSCCSVGGSSEAWMSKRIVLLAPRHPINGPTLSPLLQMARADAWRGRRGALAPNTGASRGGRGDASRRLINHRERYTYTGVASTLTKTAPRTRTRALLARERSTDGDEPRSPSPPCHRNHLPHAAAPISPTMPHPSPPRHRSTEEEEDRITIHDGGREFVEKRRAEQWR